MSLDLFATSNERSLLDDWQKAHAALMVRERAFAEVLARHGRGQASLHEMELACDQLKAARELTDTLRQEAFGAAGVRVLQAGSMPAQGSSMPRSARPRPRRVWHNARRGAACRRPAR